MSTSSNPYVATLLDGQLQAKLRIDMHAQGFEITTPPHTHFSGKKKGISCTLYTSGKLVVQGKESAEFIEFYLEPQILHTFTFRHPLAESHFTSRIGIDESGKGDFFGPLCVGGVYVQKEQFPILQSLGVRDSKTLSDAAIKKLALAIKKECLYHIVKINPPKYNQIYTEFKNLNHLLAWGHATAIEQLVEQSGCQEVIIDQFADERVVERALSRKKMNVNLTQRHKAEEDLAVAAASILARHAFVEGLASLSEEIGIALPKGASSHVEKVGREIVTRWGEERLRALCKSHFKTLDAILGKPRE